MANEADEGWKTVKSITTTTVLPKKKRRSKKKINKKLEEAKTLGTTTTVITPVPTPGFETDSVTDIENMLNLKEIKFEVIFLLII